MRRNLISPELMKDSRCSILEHPGKRVTDTEIADLMSHSFNSRGLDIAKPLSRTKLTHSYMAPWIMLKTKHPFDTGLNHQQQRLLYKPRCLNWFPFTELAFFEPQSCKQETNFSLSSHIVSYNTTRCNKFRPKLANRHTISLVTWQMAPFV